jgi:hypothetical protein
MRRTTDADSGTFSDFEAGIVFQAFQSVALGLKPAASGEIRVDAQAEFLRFVHTSQFQDLNVRFGSPTDGRIEWRVSRFTWCLDALEWLAGLRNAGDGLPAFHMHWVQGLLYGYSPYEIERYLSTRDEPDSTSRPCARSRTAESARPSRAGLSSRR